MSRIPRRTGVGFIPGGAELVPRVFAPPVIGDTESAQLGQRQQAFLSSVDSVRRVIGSVNDIQLREIASDEQERAGVRARAQVDANEYYALVRDQIAREERSVAGEIEEVVDGAIGDGLAGMGDPTYRQAFTNHIRARMIETVSGAQRAKLEAAVEEERSLYIDATTSGELTTERLQDGVNNLVNTGLSERDASGRIAPRILESIVLRANNSTSIEEIVNIGSELGVVSAWLGDKMQNESERARVAIGNALERTSSSVLRSQQELLDLEYERVSEQARALVNDRRLVEANEYIDEPRVREMLGERLFGQLKNEVRRYEAELAERDVEAYNASVLQSATSGAVSLVQDVLQADGFVSLPNDEISVPQLNPDGTEGRAVTIDLREIAQRQIDDTVQQMFAGSTDAIATAKNVASYLSRQGATSQHLQRLFAPVGTIGRAGQNTITPQQALALETSLAMYAIDPRVTGAHMQDEQYRQVQMIDVARRYRLFGESLSDAALQVARVPRSAAYSMEMRRSLNAKFDDVARELIDDLGVEANKGLVEHDLEQLGRAFMSMGNMLPEDALAEASNAIKERALVHRGVYSSAAQTDLSNAAYTAASDMISEWYRSQLGEDGADVYIAQDGANGYRVYSSETGLPVSGVRPLSALDIKQVYDRMSVANMFNATRLAAIEKQRATRNEAIDRVLVGGGVINTADGERLQITDGNALESRLAVSFPSLFRGTVSDRGQREITARIGSVADNPLAAGSSVGPIQDNSPLAPIYKYIDETMTEESAKEFRLLRLREQGRKEFERLYRERELRRGPVNG